MRDLFEEKDGAFMGTYPSPDQSIPLGEVGIHGNGIDVAIVTYGNGCYLSRKAQAVLDGHDISSRVIDLRWLAPLPKDALLQAIKGCAHVLIVDECRGTGSQSEGLMALLAEAGVASFGRITADDTFIATGPAYAASLPSVGGIVDAVRALIGGAS
jgi:2-oxoisovalerate dehydrogenase E1 component